MARAIWTGSITFGMVSIPVGLFSAAEDHTIHFHQLQRGTSDRVRNKRVNERTGDEVDYADIVKGADVGGGEHVVVEPDELASVAPGRSHSLEITGFVDPDEIDPVYFRRTYWLAPTGEQYERPYALLVSAMERVHRVGVGTFVMRGKEYTNLERSVAARRKGAKGGGERRPDLAEASKSELAELARRYDIPGRSSMNRAELAEAVDEATRESSRGRRAS